MQVTTHVNTGRATVRHPIGPAGIAARAAVGAMLVALALIWRSPHWLDFALGLVVLPAVAIGLFAWRARRRPVRLDATGPVAHLANAMVFAPLFLLPATAGAALMFYGTSMLVAATRRSGGCEVTAIANAVLGRDDQVGCVLFGPVDATEAAVRHPRRRTPPT